VLDDDGAGSVISGSTRGVPMGASRFNETQGGPDAPSDTRSVSGYSLPDPAQAAGAVMAGMTDEGRDEFESVFSKGVLSTRSPSVAGGDDASEVGGMSDFQSVMDSDNEGAVSVSRGSRRAIGLDNSSGASITTNKSVNQTIAERVLERVGTRVDVVAERRSKVQETEGGGGGVSGITTPVDKLKRAVRLIQGTVRMDIGTDLLRRIPPPPELGTVHSYIAIDCSKSMLYPTYKFYTQADDSTMDRFVLAARQEPMSLKFKHKRYIFSTDPDNCSVSAAGYWGKLSSNFMGTNFTIFDRGERRGARVDEENERRVLGAVVYEPTTTTGSGGYRKMTALLPTLYKEGDDGMPRLERWEEMRDMRYMHLLTSKTPAYKRFDGQWHYCYKFGGRVKCPSKKNFQMVLDGDQNSVVLLFGKVSNNLWVCDFTHPLSAHQAFAIALSSMSSKMCYTF